MLIGLKGDNYYSKVFIRVNYKLWNNTFWVVITYTQVSSENDRLYADGSLRWVVTPWVYGFRILVW